MAAKEIGKEVGPNDSEGYLQLLEQKQVKGRRIYSDTVVDNLRQRAAYLPVAKQLQERANNSVTLLGNTFGITEVPVEYVPQRLNDLTLGELSTIVKEGQGTPKIFIALAGPGGAGKDTVFDNATKFLDVRGRSVARVSKYTTRDSSRPGAYHFKDGIDDLYSELGDVVVSDGEVNRINLTMGIEVVDNTLTLEQLQSIENEVDKTDSTLTEWNLELSGETNFVEILYRRNRGWYATDGREIISALESADIAVITGNPQNLARMIKWVGIRSPEIIPLMVTVLPAYPSQFVSAARTLDRDGIDQTDATLLSTTGPRQTDELEILARLISEGDVDLHNAVILENDVLLSDPAQTGKVETLAGEQLGEALLGDFKPSNG